MKKNIFLIVLLLLGLTSCYKSVLDPLKGVFPAPTVVEATQASATAAKVDGERLFTLELSDGANTLHATLIGDAYYLTSNAYTEAAAGVAKKGNYILGQTSVNGKQVASGTITITQDGENYTLSAVLFLEDGTPYKVSWAGTFHFDPDPEPIVLTELLIAQANTNGTVTFKLGTAGMSVDMMGTPTGDGCALTADVYSPDGYLHEGSYTAAASSDAVGAGQYAPGYEYDLSEWGMGIMHWGTCWWSGAAVEHISQEAITVEKKGSRFVITWGSEADYPHWATFTGEIEALTPSAVPNPDYSYTDELSDPVDETFAPVAGVKTHNLTLRNAAGQEVAWFQLVLTEGVTDYSGDYFCKEYAHEDHTFGNGYDLSMWGMGMGGTRYVAADGSTVMVNPGETLTITQVGDNTWKFTGSTGYEFVGRFE